MQSRRADWEAGNCTQWCNAPVNKIAVVMMNVKI